MEESNLVNDNQVSTQLFLSYSPVKMSFTLII